jgi:hypothetical protein
VSVKLDDFANFDTQKQFLEIAAKQWHISDMNDWYKINTKLLGIISSLNQKGHY